MERLDQRVAVITGAASGIGWAMARRFAQAGMRLVLADIEQAALDRAVAELAATGTHAIGMVVDVADEAQVAALAERAYGEFGNVHLLCNNAGVAPRSLVVPAWESRLEDWRWILDVNFMGVLHGVRAFVPRMLAGGDEGHVVNTASVAGLLTRADPYHVSKHAVTCLTEGLYRDLRTMGAKVSASVLCPGLIRTQIVDADRNRQPRYGAATERATMTERDRQWAGWFAARLADGYEPSHVADQVAEAVLANRFYVVPAQPALLDLIRLRMQDITEQRNPTLPPPPA